MSTALTDGIRVEVESIYLSEHSDPDEPRYVFAYRVSIRNEGDEAARLLARHWVITDAAAGVEEVKGAGVIGETPRIGPGETHQYQSFCVLKTPRGSMSGSYQMVRDDGRAFDAEIAEFMLSPPNASKLELN